MSVLGTKATQVLNLFLVFLAAPILVKSDRKKEIISLRLDYYHSDSFLTNQKKEE